MDRLTEAEISAWIEGYLAAWRSNDPDDIQALFTADAEYRTAGYRAPHVGSDAIARMWLGRLDPPGTWTFSWRVVAVDGRRAVVQGETDYDDGERYANLWVVDLVDDRRAASFTEWWMDRAGGDPEADATAG